MTLFSVQPSLEEQLGKSNSPSRGEQRIVACQDIEKGTTILQELPLACILKPCIMQETCSFCWKNKRGSNSALKRCSQCKVPRYCSKGCQINHWKKYHSKECNIIQQLMQSHPSEKGLFAHPNLMQALLLAIRILISGQISKTNKLIHHKKSISGEFFEFLTAAARLMLSKIPQANLLGVNEDDIVNLLCRLQCNVFNICDEETIPVGVGLFLNAANLNHSCRPNTFCSFDAFGNQQLTIRSLCNIAKGDEITISYIEIMQPSALRYNDLFSSFYFNCKCNACESPQAYDRKTEGYKCLLESCDGFYRVRNQKPDECDTCGNLHREFVLVYKNILGFNNWNNWRECWAHFDDIAASPTHLDRLILLENAYQAALVVSNVSEAVDIYRRKLEIIEELVPENWPTLGLCYGTYGVLLSELGQFEEAKASLIRALTILEVGFPSSHDSISRFNQELNNVQQHLFFTAARK